MIGSKGSAAGLEIKADSLVEFIIGRHMIYPFVYYAYEELNDILVVMIFAISVFIIIKANICEHKRNGILNELFVFTWLSFACIAASFIMRLPMSALFDGYKSTHPDNYYYGCNILYCVLVLYSLYITVQRHIKFFCACMICFVVLFIANDNLFPVIEKDKGTVVGKSIGMDEWKDCLEDAVECNRMNKCNYTVFIHPFTDEEAWRMELPGVYVWASIE